jgi:glycogen phosphorylase
VSNDSFYGHQDVQQAAEELAQRLPGPLAKLAELAFNYRWSWTPGGEATFASVAPHRWHLARHNPVRLLRETSTAALEQAAQDEGLVREVERIHAELVADLRRPHVEGAATVDRPVAFLCAEYGVHRSLPVYSGGLGALAGDIVKEASDLALPLVAVGLMYHQGYFHQRLDVTGWQHEYWSETDPEQMPAALVTGADGTPLKFTVPIREREVVVQIWRVDVGRVPLYLLDTRIPENNRVDRWITSRLYVGDHEVRLAQYALLGRGAVRALDLLDIDPQVVHLNEGHPALAPLEMTARDMAAGMSFDDAYGSARTRTVFTTHTPVPAGNETYSPDEVASVTGDLPEALGLDIEGLMDLARIQPGDRWQQPGMTVLGLRSARSSNAVSRRHGEVARRMWQPVFGVEQDRVPIGHVTNGAHVPTWMAPPMRALLDRYLGEDWSRRAADPEVWAGVENIPDAELWAVRNTLRGDLVEFVRDHSMYDRLNRGEPAHYVEAAAQTFAPDVLTVGFARRVATYKRLHLLTQDPARALALLDGPQHLQILIAGKAHPRDDEAKTVLRRLFELKGAPAVAGHVAYLEDYDLAMASRLVAGCDIWLNLPRPPMEASGTSGMKSAFNGGLNLSVLDGWWAEAFDGTNGWGIDGAEHDDHDAQDARDADRLYGLLDGEVLPEFCHRDEDGVPRRWVQRIKRSLQTVGPAFSATRMLRDYWEGPYRG